MPTAEASFNKLTEHLGSHFSNEIADFRSIARLHGLEIGAPAHLASLPLRLSQDGRLRSDFSEMFRALQDRDADFSLADALTVLTLAVGGPAAFAPRPDLDEPKSLLGGFLSTLGHWPGADNQPITDLDNPPDHDPRLDLQAAARAEELRAREVAHQTADLPTLPSDSPDFDDPAQAPALETEDNDAEAISALTPNPADDSEAHRQSLEALTLSRITDVLARLERGNLELRLHLDSIDQRISRMEPLLESVPHHEAAAAPAPALTPTAAKPAPAEAAAAEVQAAAAPAAAVEPPLVHRDQRPPVVSPVPQPPAATSPRTPSAAPDPVTLAPGRLSLDTTEAKPATPHDPDRRLALEPLAPAPAVAPAPAPAPTTAVAPAPAPKSATAPAPAKTPTLSAPGDPRAARQPRRDRFAAARELPGFRSEVLDRPALESKDPEPPTPAPAPTPDPDLLRSAPRTPDPAAKAANPAPPAVTPAAETTSSAPRLFSSLTPASADTATGTEPAPSRRGAILGTIAVILLVAIASFVFVYGSPVPLLDRLFHPQSDASAPVSQPSSAPSTTTGPTSPAASPAPTRSAKPSAAPATSGQASSGRVLGAREAFTPSESAEDTTTPVQSTDAPTFVPEAVMDGHLLSAPHPIYPKLANIVGVRGRVVFEAMISKEGNVESLRALGGSRFLRDAASNAVRQWEYRPFLVKGAPVEVRTIIRVDVDPDATE